MLWGKGARRSSQFLLLDRMEAPGRMILMLPPQMKLNGEFNYLKVLPISDKFMLSHMLIVTMTQKIFRNTVPAGFCNLG